MSLSSQADSTWDMDWDDIEGNTARRLEGLRQEKRRKEESRRLKAESRAAEKEGVVVERRAVSKH